MVNKSERITIRFTGDEFKFITKFARDMDMPRSNAVKLCLNSFRIIYSLQKSSQNDDNNPLSR
jgi:hypothetical protein